MVIFAATATNLYKLNNSTFQWANVSKSGGPYTTVDTDKNWSFCQFNSLVFACNGNVNLQQFNIVSDSAFSDTSGSPPQANYAAVINSFLVLSGLSANPNRVQWSGLGDTTNWTAGVNSSDYQDLPDGGLVRGVVGGELGVIISDARIRIMTFSPGSDVIFNIYMVDKDVGCIAPYSIIQSNQRIFFLSAQGWQMTDATGALTPIGAEKVDRYFLGKYDPGHPELVIGAIDPQKNTCYWIAKSNGSSQTYADFGIAYNWLLNRWSPFTGSFEYLGSLITPGLTLEGLDQIVPGALTITGAANNGSGLIRLAMASTSTLSTGQKIAVSGVGGTTEANNTATNGWWVITVIDSTHVDLQGSTFTNAYTSGGIIGGSLDSLPTPLDTLTSKAIAGIAGVDSTHTIGFFSGPNLEATFETAEQTGPDGQRLFVSGFAPITDAPTVYGSISYRENLNAARSYTSEATMNAYGYCCNMRSTRYARGKVRIPAATLWTFCRGIAPDSRPDGYA